MIFNLTMPFFKSSHISHEVLTIARNNSSPNRTTNLELGPSSLLVLSRETGNSCGRSFRSLHRLLVKLTQEYWFWMRYNIQSARHALFLNSWLVCDGRARGCTTKHRRKELSGRVCFTLRKPPLFFFRHVSWVLEVNHWWWNVNFNKFLPSLV